MSLTDTAPKMTAGPLAGVKVLELGSFIAGPFAGQLLGDYGADVVKVEAPDTGDPMRAWGVTTPEGDSLWWPTIARNKRSVTADLRAEDGQAFVQRLAAEADVILENFRPGRLEGWGLDYATVRATNPGVIMVHVSGFGQTGPRSDEAGFGSIGEAFGGIRHTTGDPDRPPARCGVSLGDSLAALFAVIGATSALVERERSGEGQEVDVAIYEAVAALMESSMADHEVGGVLRQRSGGALKGVAPANAYPCADGSEVLIAGNADAVFRRLCAAMGRPELADDDRYATHAARGEHETELDDLVADWTRARSGDDVLASMKEHGVPAGRVYTAADMVDDLHYHARDMVLRAEARAGFELPMTGIVPRFGRTPGSVRDVGPGLGEHTADLADTWSPPSTISDAAAGGETTGGSSWYRSVCRDLAPVLAEHAAAGETERRLPDAVIEAVVDADILRAVVPRSLGGHGLGLDDLCHGARLLAQGDPAQAWTLSFFQLHAWMLSRFPAVDADHYDPARFPGGAPRIAAPLAPTGTAVPVDGGYRVRGRWEFATGVNNAHQVMVHAIVDGVEGFETIFALLPTDAYTVEDDWHTSGMRSTGSHAVSLDDVFVPTDATVVSTDLYQAGDQPRWAGDGMGTLPMLAALALVASAPAVGAAEAGLDHYQDRLRSRVLAYTLGDKAAEQPAGQMRLATVTAEIDALRGAWDRAVDRTAALATVPEASDDDRVRARLAAADAVRRARAVLGAIGEGAGASVYRSSHPIQRLQRDVETLKGHVVFDWDRSTELVGRVLLGMPLRPTDMV